ncbi:hypothetical protein E0H26_22835 [Micromonospora zingiberis]|uniref:Uncharacterized protein n=1 Tax=Micromonospora zingiberis TaxID=2053011 RepID=A0A4R0G8V6_9ACTN|nr:hypothetical protein [Micromonospora zingiberis]TCB93380.1 hypothetical protein E0H26_22835 [Micromonospora zingiberis]
MSHPRPETPSARKLVWASEDVLAQVGDQIQPPVSLPRQTAQVATVAFLFISLPAFAVLAVTTIVAPSVTSGAGIGRVAFWAAQLGLLFAIGAAVATLWRRGGMPKAATSNRVAVLRIGRNLLCTAAGAWLVLALQGLAIGQILTLVVVLVVVLDVLPVTVARLLGRQRRRRADRASDPVA